MIVRRIVNMTGDFEFMTYDDAASRLGIAQASVRRQAARNKWPKKKRNDGRISVGIPVARLSIDKPIDSHDDTYDKGSLIQELQHRISILEIELLNERKLNEITITDRDNWKSQADAWQEQAQYLLTKRRRWFWQK